MSQIGIDFANQWIAQNIQPTFYTPGDTPHPDTKTILTRFLADAERI